MCKNIFWLGLGYWFNFSQKRLKSIQKHSFQGFRVFPLAVVRHCEALWGTVRRCVWTTLMPRLSGNLQRIVYISVLLKGSVTVISSDPPFLDQWHARFTMVHFEALIVMFKYVLIDMVLLLCTKDTCAFLYFSYQSYKVFFIIAKRFRT